MLKNSEGRKDNEVLKEDTSMVDSLLEDKMLLVEVLNMEELEVRLHMMEQMEHGPFLPSEKKIKSFAS